MVSKKFGGVIHMEFKIGLCQMKIGEDKTRNLNRAKALIQQAVQQGAEMAVLPEMFNCPYNQEFFPRFAESEPNGETVEFLADLAREYHCYIVGGSIPEREGDCLYNTSFVFNREGHIIAKHRKVHLFDVDIPGGISFQESAVLSSGHKITSFQTHFGRFGLAICYDIRFPELFRLLVAEDVKLVIVPAAFNMTTGPAHWNVLFRARAIDNQIFMVGVSPARDTGSSYIAYGHSLVVDPFGNVVWEAGAEETVGMVCMDMDLVEKTRQGLPLLKHRRLDLYGVECKKG
jgi:predicted amidohydrolase